MKRLFQVTAVVMVLVFLTFSSGCYGSFPMVTKVYKWNGTIGDKWVNEIAFLALNIVPVYGIAAFIDAVILNSIEFWTGNKPMSSIDLPDRDASVAANANDGTITFTSNDGAQLFVTMTSDGAEVRDAEGNLLARSVKGTDGVTVYDAGGSIVGTMSNSQIEAAAGNLR